MPNDDFILEMSTISKSFGAVKALKNVNFKVKRGEIHCLVGENGAGKSTLMKILSGVYPYSSYEGSITLNGEIQKFKNIDDSEKAKIAIIYQELALIPDMSIYENIYLGHEIAKAGFVNFNETIKKTKEILQKVKLKINPETEIKDLGIGKKQLIEIAKAFSKDANLIILDEPTAALNEDDSENLLDLLKQLRSEGITCIMISHKLKEIISIADSVTILRDGETICTIDAKENNLKEADLIKHMVGRDIDDIYPKRPVYTPKKIIFEVSNLCAINKDGKKILENININLRQGEVVGIAGLMGSGRTELAYSIFGNPKNYKITGKIIINGKELSLKHPKDAINSKIAYVTEDRKGEGLILSQDIKQNISISNLKNLKKYGYIDENAEIREANKYKKSLVIKTPSIEQAVGKLSGGNQQKVSLAKWLFTKPDILILDEPTRGIDVGAKFEIYTIVNMLIQQGMSIIIISSELPEVLGMSDRIYVMSSGKITGELDIKDATQNNIMEYATKYDK